MKQDISKVEPDFKPLMEYIRGVEKEVYNRFGVIVNLAVKELESPFSMDLITYLVSDTLGVSIDKIMNSAKGDMEVSAARHIAMYLIKKYIPKVTLVAIGRFFKRDHTTIIYALDHIEGVVFVKDPVAEKVLKCENILIQLKGNKNESQLH